MLPDFRARSLLIVGIVPCSMSAWLVMILEVFNHAKLDQTYQLWLFGQTLAIEVSIQSAWVVQSATVLNHWSCSSFLIAFLGFSSQPALASTSILPVSSSSFSSGWCLPVTLPSQLYLHAEARQRRAQCQPLWAVNMNHPTQPWNVSSFWWPRLVSRVTKLAFLDKVTKSGVNEATINPVQAASESEPNPRCCHQEQDDQKQNAEQQGDEHAKWRKSESLGKDFMEASIMWIASDGLLFVSQGWGKWTNAPIPKFADYYQETQWPNGYCRLL